MLIFIYDILLSNYSVLNEHGLEKDLSKGSYFATERFAKVFKTNSA
jgi:hypothetical protein